MAWRAILAAAVCGLAATLACAQEAASKPLTPEQNIELKTLTGQLADPQRDAKTKLEAAILLLNRPYPQAADALKAFLSDGANRPAQIAVAEAIARQTASCSKVFIDPLVAMLTGSEPGVRAPAGRALAAYRDDCAGSLLVGVATDRKNSAAVRLAAIAAMDRILSKEAVSALVALADDADDAISTAAADSLSRLTRIHAFGNDRWRWKEWWQRNKDKDRSEWLADLADSLAVANASLTADNDRLRSRLAETIASLYSSTPTSQRDAMLLGILKDPLADIRLAGAKIIELNLANNVEVSKDVRLQVRSMLADADPRLRSAMVGLTAALGDGESAALLLDRLSTEEAPAVRLAILKALGLLRDGMAVPTILKEIGAKSDESAAVAASALAKIAAGKPLTPSQRTQAVEALVKRYSQTPAAGAAPLREALLKAMGAVGDKEFLPVLLEALKDADATIRLAAVEALKSFDSPAVGGELEKLLADSDRGVRQATIIALARLGGSGALKLLLKRTDSAVEQDPAVRQQAWDEAMAILAKADAKALRDVLAALADRKDAAAQQIRVLQMLAGVLKAQDSPELPAVQWDLGGALMKAERPAEAAPVLGEAYAGFVAVKSDSAAAVWADWIDAMLAADDVAAIKAIAEQTADALTAHGMRSLLARIDLLQRKESWAAVALLGGEAIKQLSKRLSPTQRAELEMQVKHAREQLGMSDRQRIGTLLRQLTAAEDATRKAAEADLLALGDRAVGPLVEELRKTVDSAKGDADLEKAILGVLRQIAPKLTGYDPTASRAERLKRIDAWQQASTGS